MSGKIQVFSPHFDDVALSCGEHVLRWRKAGRNVEVYTVFSQFESKYLSEDSQNFMKKSQSADAQSFQHTRAMEDTKSMKLLDVQKFFWLGFTDGGFRSHDQRPVYETHKVLFSGDILDEAEWLKKVKASFLEVVDPDATVVFPLGIGQHADHLIVKKLLQEIVPKEQQVMYVDIPYAFTMSNWRWNQVKDFFLLPKSLMWSSPQKIKAVEAYVSQVPTLFYEQIWFYPECLIGSVV